MELASAGAMEENRGELGGNSEIGKGDLLRRSRFLWVGGEEPLDHADVANAANALAAGKEHVFLETAGELLKPRIHEFKPGAGFYFVVRMDGPASLTTVGCHEDSCRVALEAMRMARLAGFYTFAHLVYRREFALRALESLHKQICKIGTDDVFITTAPAAGTDSKEFVRLRRRMLDHQARWFSRQIEESSRPSRQQDSLATPRIPARESRQEDFEQGAEAQ